MNAPDRYNWHAQSNRRHLEAAFDHYLAEHGQVCQGVAACGIRESQGRLDAQPHPAAKLVPIAVYPVSVGGEPDGAVLVLCGFCVQRWLAVVAGGLEVLANPACACTDLGSTRELPAIAPIPHSRHHLQSCTRPNLKRQEQL